MGQKIAGTCYVKTDAGQLTVAGSVSANMQNINRESVQGLNERAGFKEMSRSAFIEVEVIIKPETDLSGLQDLTGAGVTAELANGKVAVLTDADQVGDMDVNAVDATVTIRFEGIGKWL